MPKYALPSIVFFTAFNTAVSVAVVSIDKDVEEYRIAPSDDGMRDERNERSTPREFVLPATPAVTKIVEERRERSTDVVSVRCLVALTRLERPVYFSEPANSAANRAAVFEFQRDSGLPKHGKLDSATRESLACN